jgi:hypothetical protein
VIRFNDMICILLYHKLSATSLSHDSSLSMLRFGIYTQNQFMKAGEHRRFSGSRVSYSLLNIGENPTREQIQIFEDISFMLPTSN